MRMPGFSAEASLCRVSDRFEYEFSENDLRTSDVIAAQTIHPSCIFLERLLKSKDPSKKDCKLICDSNGNPVRWHCHYLVAFQDPKSPLETSKQSNFNGGSICISPWGTYYEC